MALQTNYTTQHGLSIQSAYIRVSYVHGDKNNLCIEFAVYPSKLLRDAGKPCVEAFNFTVSHDLEFRGNSIQLAYSEMKKRNEFKEATDV